MKVEEGTIYSSRKKIVLKKKCPLVSAIIPTYNSSRTLESCLRSIDMQNYTPIELIIVDKYSKDGTQQIAADHQARVFLKGPERSAQKNWGAKFAKGALLYFIDSDFILEKDAISICVEACAHFDAVSTLNYSTGDSLWGKSIALKEKFLAIDPTIQTVRFIRKEVFLESGGFDENLIVGEDLDLYRRLQERRYAIGSARAIEWHIGEPQTLRDLVKRSVYYGKVVGTYFNKREGYAAKQLSPFKLNLFWSLIKTGSPYLFSLCVVDITRWLSTFVGLLLKKTATT